MPDPASPSAPGPSAALDSAIVRELMDSIPDRIYFKDRQSRFVRNNVAQARLLGAASPAECTGKSDFDYFTPEHAARAFADEQEIIRTGRPIIGKVERIERADGLVEWVSTTKLPWHDEAGNIIGTFGLTRDITATKLAEDKLLEERNLLRTIIDHLPSRVYVKDLEARYVLNNAAHLRYLGLASQEDAAGHVLTDFVGGERATLAQADDRQVIERAESVLNQERCATLPDGSTRWSLTTKVPLRNRAGEMTGLVGIAHDITARKQAEELLHRHLAEMEADIRMARQLQESFLSRTPPCFPASASPEQSALRFAHRYLPATTLAGDFFALLPISDTQCGVLVCDVMGHGLRAGLLTALIRGVVEELGASAADPAHVLGEVNARLCPLIAQNDGQPVFATAFYAAIDTEKRSLAYANAGHPPPVFLPRRGATLQLLASDDPEPAAGLVTGFHYSARQCAFGPGDRLLIFTDGLVEAATPGGTLFGENQLIFSLGRHQGHDLGGLCDALLRDVQRFCGTDRFEDDVCLVAIEGAMP